MRQPEGYIVDDSQPLPDEPPNAPQRGRIVCRLLKTLYGTKQASHAWNKEVNSFLTNALG